MVSPFYEAKQLQARGQLAYDKIICNNLLKSTKSNFLKESGTIFKPWDGKLRIALAFPNTYYVGMSNLGFQLLYRLFNNVDNVLCERVFLPDSMTLRQLQRSNKPLTSFESNHPLSDFHVIAFSLPFENDYLNILTMLKLSRIAVMRKQRKSLYPLLIAGGVCIFLNPEPLSEIFDMFIIGEGEEVIAELLDVLGQMPKGQRTGREQIEQFAEIEGVYIPSAYRVVYNSDGTIKKIYPRKGFPGKIKRRWVSDLNRFPACSFFTATQTEFSQMVLTEVSRGCPNQCRFCAAGHVYRPYRTRELSLLQQSIMAGLKENKKIGLLGAAVSDYPYLGEILKFAADRGSPVSVSSLRADSLTDELVAILKQSGHRTFTIAPEAGSERLRHVIGKQLTNDDIFRTVATLARHRVANVKLYFLIGLPTEDDEDIDAIVDFTKKVKHLYYKESHGGKCLNQLTLAISPFIPKASTPFQWHPFDDMEALKRKLKIIRNALKKERKVLVTYNLPKWGYTQTLLGRGDRRAGFLLLKCFEKNGNWTSAFKEALINPDFYVYRKRDISEVLPWDFIDHGIEKEFLWRQYQDALKGL